MSVHYDVETAVANFRKSVSDMAVPAGLPDHVYIQKRNPEVSVAIFRMLLTECNLGSNPMDILSAFGSIVVSNVVNIARPFEGREAEVYDAFVSHVAHLFDLETAGDPNSLNSEFSDIPSERGGHA